MGKKAPLQEVDPLCLPLGMRVGAWQIRGWRGRGTNGTVYRVEAVEAPERLRLAAPSARA
jgi:eukaryotic-like serine/threonine-protein kinase